AAAEAMLMTAAADVDADPMNRTAAAELIARRTRAVVETAVEETLSRTARALGPAPLSQDGRHAQRGADLAIYVRQSHAERDLDHAPRACRAAGRQHRPVRRAAAGRRRDSDPRLAQCAARVADAGSRRLCRNDSGRSASRRRNTGLWCDLGDAGGDGCSRCG